MLHEDADDFLTRVGEVLGVEIAAPVEGADAPLAAFGLTFISAFLVSQQDLLAMVGGAFLCYLGVRTFLSGPAEGSAEAGGKGLLGMYTSTFFLTLTNPLTILSFAAIYAGLGLASISQEQSGAPASGYLSAALVVLGVVLGSASWWLLLSGTVSLFRSRVTPNALRWINRRHNIQVIISAIPIPIRHSLTPISLEVRNLMSRSILLASPSLFS